MMYLNKKVPLERKGNTKIYNDDDYLIVALYDTPVFVIDKKRDTVALSSGGWQTVTTKQRINQASEEYYCGFQVYQKNFVWYVALKDGETVPFKDGMKLDCFTGKLITQHKQQCCARCGEDISRIEDQWTISNHYGPLCGLCYNAIENEGER